MPSKTYFSFGLRVVIGSLLLSILFIAVLAQIFLISGLDQKTGMNLTDFYSIIWIFVSFASNYFAFYLTYKNSLAKKNLLLSKSIWYAFWVNILLTLFFNTYAIILQGKSLPNFYGIASLIIAQSSSIVAYYFAGKSVHKKLLING